MTSDSTRRGFLTATAALVGAALPLNIVRSQDAKKKSAAVAKAAVKPDAVWHNVADSSWGVEGKGWSASETERYYDRLPIKAKGKVRDAVWGLSRDSAGMVARFETNARAIHVRYKLRSARLDMPHMPATGVSGLDLYARDDQGRERWVDVTRPAAQVVEETIGAGVDALPNGARRQFALYLPLYNGVESLEVGVDPKADFAPLPPRKAKSIVFYGTSIMHGACASRPGMSISALVGRRFDRPTINLGFSGNGRMEAEVGALLAELDPAVYAIDCLPNMGGAEVAERAEALVKQLRQARPETPILLVEDRTFTNAAFRASMRNHHAASRAALRKAYENLTAAGVKHLSYLEGQAILGDDGEAATDGSHPNDLGMVRYADAYEKALRPLLG